jgi:hypothetical protein
MAPAQPPAQPALQAGRFAFYRNAMGIARQAMMK